MRTAAALLYPFLALALTLPLEAVSPKIAPIRSLLHLRVPMRDRVTLCANVFLPGVGRWPVLLVRTPYNKGMGITPHYEAYVRRGYALVIQDVRGRYHSRGVFRPLDQETADGEDTIGWIARQSWSNGAVGMFGGSYLGIAQWRVAPLNNPHLKAIFPVVSGSDEYLDRFYSPGGAFKLGHRLLWMSENLGLPGGTFVFDNFIRHSPLRSADIAATGRRVDFFQQAMDHPAYDGYWRAISAQDKLERVRVPVFAVGGWYDNFVESDLEAFSRLRKAGRSNRLLVGPWAHSPGWRFSGIDFGPDAAVPLRSIQLDWFDRWLKGIESPSGSPLRLFVMGINQWRDEEEWPLTRARVMALYVDSDGHANTLHGDGVLSWTRPGNRPADGFLYDPRNPVPTAGGSVCCNPQKFPWGPMDQRTLEARDDVLVYTSAPLKEDLEVTGPVRAVLYVSSSAPDTDFTAKLVDVSPSGFARNLTDGILRLRYRDSLSASLPGIPGEVYAVTISVGPTSNVFLKGHRIRLEVSSSNFPRFDRNPNTGRAIADETEMHTARQTVYHDRMRPSHLLLPVVPSPSAKKVVPGGTQPSYADRVRAVGLQRQ